MRKFLRLLLMVLVLMTVALISALTAMQLAIHGREVTVPKVLGLSPTEAERAGGALGLQIAIEAQFYSSDVPEGRIMTQMPPPGTKVRRGWPVRVAESLGPQRISIPDVTGGSERIAELNITRRGLTLGSIAHIEVPETSPDRVVSQSPPAKASGVAAPKISLLVSEGPPMAEYVMPNLTGQPLGSAALALQDAGMKVGRVSVVLPALQPGDTQIAPSGASEPSPASMIVTQTPAPGQKVDAGTAVNFEVR